MILSALTLSLAAMAPEPARVEALANGQFRITVARRGLDSSIFVRAILDIRAEAARRCQGRGDPVEIGRGEISALPNERWEMSAIYACATAVPAPPATAPDGT
jgi:hypothetical protein